MDKSRPIDFFIMKNMKFMKVIQKYLSTFMCFNCFMVYFLISQ